MAEEIKKTIGQRIIDWLRNPYNLALVGILLFALALRLYYFFITRGQPIWWDEAEYMDVAKHWAFGIPFDLNPQRPPLFQFLSSLIFMTGLGEATIKLLLVIIPSVLLVYFVYLLGKEMFDKKIGLIAALLTSVSWTFLFWTARLQPDFLSMCFQVLAILFMWRYWKTNSMRYIVYSGIFTAVGFYFKISALIVPMIFIIFIFIKERLSALRNKNYYIFGLTFLAVLLPYFIWSHYNFDTFTAFTTGYTGAAEAHKAFAWYTLKFFSFLTEYVVLYLFLIGLIISFKFIFSLDILIKDKTKCLNPDIFTILSLVVISAFYIFYIRDAEDRWVFLWLPFIFIMVAKAIIEVSGFLKKYGKIFSVIAVIVLLGLGIYFQIVHADGLINNKKTSYSPVKDAALWLKSNSDKNDIIVTLSSTQTIYYSEREIISLSHINSSENFDKIISLKKPRFLELSIFEQRDNQGWVNQWLDANKNNLIPVQVYYADSARTQVVLVIYEFKRE